MSKGQDYYPWTHKNVLEALENRNDELFLTSTIIAGAEAGEDVRSYSFIGMAVKKSIFEYWKEAAEKQAHIEYERKD
jgi:ribosomal protein S18 acetylase RimI-like enzyme